MNSFQKYLRSLSPTRLGILSLFSICLLFPILMDIGMAVLYPAYRMNFSMTGFLARGFAGIFLLIPIYLLVFYFVSSVFNRFGLFKRSGS